MGVIYYWKQAVITCPFCSNDNKFSLDDTVLKPPPGVGDTVNCFTCGEPTTITAEAAA